MDQAEAGNFLDGMIQDRIGIRGNTSDNLFSVLAEHYLALKEDFPNYIGIINTNLHPKKIIDQCCHYVQELCNINYGSSPEFKVNGHTDTVFTYIPVHLEYMLMETLKNSFRATVEYSKKIQRVQHPALEITLCNSKEDVMIRIRDYGGGIPLKDLEKVFEYSYTTVPKYDETDQLFSTQARLQMQNAVGGPMAGLGFGLPMTRIYAKYFGGEFVLKSLHGHGADTFLRLPNILYLENEVEI